MIEKNYELKNLVDINLQAQLSKSDYSKLQRLLMKVGVTEKHLVSNLIRMYLRGNEGLLKQMEIEESNEKTNRFTN